MSSISEPSGSQSPRSAAQKSKKTSSSETGHAKNVANFEDLIAFCVGYGTVYNPSKNSLKVVNLNTLFTSAQASLQLVNTKFPAYGNAVALRKIEYEKMEKIVMRILYASRFIDIPKEELELTESIVRKIKGKRSKPLSDKEKTSAQSLDENSEGTSIEGQESKKTSSVSQRSFDKRADHFALLIQQVSTFTAYSPNENELKTNALNTLSANIKALNTAVISATIPLSNARIARNKILYDSEVGLVAVANDVKLYVKSLFGLASPEYRQISHIIFKAYKL